MDPASPSLIAVDTAGAAELLRSHWGREVPLQPLTSYEDRNFALLDGEGRPNLVLRIQNVGDSERLALEALILRQLAQELPGVAPELVPTLQGEDCVILRGPQGQNHLARLMTWIPGPLLAECEHLNLETWTSLGDLLGRVDRCLAGLRVDPGAGHHSWTMESSGALASLLPTEPDPNMRRLFEQALLLHGGFLQGALGDQPQQLLFYDANEFNLTAQETSGGTRVTGLFDLGDAAVSARVTEIGIAFAYAVQLAPEDPLDLALALLRGYHGQFPLRLEELPLVLPCAAARLTMSLLYGRAAREANPDNSHLSQHKGDGAEALGRLMAITPERAAQHLAAGLGLAPPQQPPRPADKAELLAARKAVLNPALSLSYEDPLVLVRGRGSYLFDGVDRPYLDCVNNVAHVGHSHPRVVRALAQQAARLNTNSRYLHPLRLAYAQRLVDLFPAPLSQVQFVNSGSEATELALRMARAATGGDHLIVVGGGYHGNSAGAMGVSSYKFNAPGGAGAPDRVHEIPCPDPRGGIHRGPDSAELYAQEVQRVCLDVEASGGRVAALLAEPLIGCGGQIVPPQGWLRRAAAFACEHGALVIVDEVQVGFGRVGDAWWAFEQEDFVPDIVTLGKPMGNGHPLGAVVSTSSVGAAFAQGPEYFNTYGGNPVSCAVGMAVLDVIEDEGLLQRAARVGQHLIDGLKDLAQDHPVMADCRGRGLYLGVAFEQEGGGQLPAAARLQRVVQKAQEAGVLLSSDGPDHNVLKIKPSLGFSIQDADLLLAVLRRALEETR